jgi:hypothetical protein
MIHEFKIKLLEDQVHKGFKLKHVISILFLLAVTAAFSKEKYFIESIELSANDSLKHLGDLNNNSNEGKINFGNINTAVKGSSLLPVSVNFTDTHRYDSLKWEIIQRGGSGIQFEESRKTTHQTDFQNKQVRVNVDAKATSNSFTIRVRGVFSDSDQETKWVYSDPIKVIDAPSIQKSKLKVISHDTRSRLPTVTGSTFGGEWKVNKVKTKNNPNSPWTRPPKDVEIANGSDTINAFISEAVIAQPSLAAGTLTASLTWGESFSSNVYTVGYTAPTLEVTFIGCQNDVYQGSGEIIQMMYDYDGDGVAEYSWCARQITDEKGNIWLDRNMGAYRLARSSDDAASYGDLYQWGRPMDGHQKRFQRDDDPAEGEGEQGEMLHDFWEDANNLSNTPSDPRFIEGDDSPSTQNYDWVDDNNDKRWAIDPQGPCPSGYHVPTQEELIELRSLINSKGRNSIAAFASLWLPAPGKRLISDGTLESVGSRGFYHSSTLTGGSKAYGLYFHASGCSPNANFHAIGFAVRCRKD